MSVQNSENKRESLKLLTPDKAKEMLGVNLAPDGNNKAQLTAIKEKMRKYAEYIRVGHVNRHEAWISLSMIALKSLEYSLPAMTLTEEECNDIMKPLLKQFLPKAGINRNIKRDLLYAPISVQGFNLKFPFITQGVSHVKDITENLWKQTTTGALIRCNLEQLGDNTSILESEYEKYKTTLLTDSFVRDSWKFMSQHNITLKDDTAPIPLLREGDSCIMQDFRNNPLITKDVLPVLNRCRLYLHAFTLSDISTGSGTHIRDEAWNRVSYESGRDTSQWPVWGKPAQASWTQWRTALQTTYCQEKNKVLSKTLGNWTYIPETWKWFSIIHNDRPTLILEHEQQYYMYKSTGRSKLVLRFYKRRKKVTNLNTTILTPVTVKSIHNCYFMSVSISSSVVQTYVHTPSHIHIKWLNIEKY